MSTSVIYESSSFSPTPVWIFFSSLLLRVEVEKHSSFAIFFPMKINKWIKELLTNLYLMPSRSYLMRIQCQSISNKIYSYRSWGDDLFYIDIYLLLLAYLVATTIIHWMVLNALIKKNRANDCSIKRHMQTNRYIKASVYGATVNGVANAHGYSWFKSWTRLSVFHIVLLLLRKLLIQLFSF